MTPNPIFRKWVQSRVGAIPSEPYFLTGSNYFIFQFRWNYCLKIVWNVKLIWERFFCVKIVLNKIGVIFKRPKCALWVRWFLWFSRERKLFYISQKNSEFCDYVILAKFFLEHLFMNRFWWMLTLFWLKFFLR